ncbi:MAG TPA: ABC transporter permease [Candidatus Bathyarchaeia archaeon]|nr:ABC transporter permease [Candidatus Bathyarchaeia archaeon]
MFSSPIQVSASSKTVSEPSNRLVLQMALRDVSVLFRTPWIIITRGLAFVIQVFVFANLISTLVRFSGINFFEYYSVGSVVTTIASISFVIGYDIFEEAEEGVLDYLLTLPVSRRQFIIGRALGGAIRAIIYTIPMFTVVAVFWGFNQPLPIVSALLSLFLLAFGVTGMAITLAVSVKTANRFDVVIALLELAVSRASVALYPLAALPSYVRGIAPFSPVSFASTNAWLSLSTSTPDLLSIAALAVFVAIFLGLGAAFYFRRLEGGVHA